jgi:hypothetical protein
MLVLAAPLTTLRVVVVARPLRAAMEQVLLVLAGAATVAQVLLHQLRVCP